MDIIFLAAQLEQVAVDKILVVRLVEDGSLIVVVDNGILGCPKHIYTAEQAAKELFRTRNDQSPNLQLPADQPANRSTDQWLPHKKSKKARR